MLLKNIFNAKPRKPVERRRPNDPSIILAGKTHLYKTRLKGCTYNCHFDGDEERQDNIIYSKRGDLVYLRPYKWEGKNAYAVFNARTKCELGVLSANMAERMDKKLEGHTVEDVIGVILELKAVDRGGDLGSLYPVVELFI